MEENKSITINCPICKSNEAVNILDLNCGNLDNSILYQSVRINACTECGHIYNRLLPDEIEKITKYYNKESAPLNLSLINKSGDRPGSDSPFAFKRYTELYNIISPYIHNDFRVLDVGCATGGFLDYLHEQGLSKLYGIDIVENYVNFANKKSNYIIKLGNVQSIPLDDASVDLLVMDQVMEHLADPAKALKEAKRVLVDGGLLCIGVPDASRYDTIYFFDFFWFLVREHIQHFDIEHLKILAELEGFKLITYHRSNALIVSEKMILPNLNVIFRLTHGIRELNISEDYFKLKKEIERYIAKNFEKLNKKREIINSLIASQKPLYIWGIGREFLYLYESAGLKNCNIVGLIDMNPYKQKTFTVSGRRIEDKSILKKAKSDSFLIITATAHIKQIKDLLSNIGYRGQTIEI
jgi:ubiquinone/menaquinone biosynthesis C-methylase UbiE